MREESSFSAIFVPERSRSISHFVNDIGNFLNYRADYRCFVCGAGPGRAEQARVQCGWRERKRQDGRTKLAGTWCVPAVYP